MNQPACSEPSDSQMVEVTVTIPKWMDDMAAKAGLDLSLVLQQAIKTALGLN